MLILTSSLISLKLSSFNKIQYLHIFFKKERRHLWKTFPKRNHKHDTGEGCAPSQRGESAEKLGFG